MLMKRISLVAILVLTSLVFRPGICLSDRDTTCGAVLTDWDVVEQLTTAWCAFACLEFLSYRYSSTWLQCHFAKEACPKYPRSGLIYTCALCCQNGCNNYYLTTHELDDFMNDVGFQCAGGGNCTRLVPMTNFELIVNICNQEYVVCTFESTVAHACVIWKVFYDSADPNDNMIFLNNPALNFMETASYSSILSGSIYGVPGAWSGQIRTTGFSPPYVDISDIAAFTYTGYQDIYGMEMEYRLALDANLADSLALYVSDNPYGPARLIRGHVRLPSSYVGTITSARWPYESDYYYFLDFNSGPFQLVRSPLELYANWDNPVWWDEGIPGMNPPRPVFDAPSNVAITDVPLDDGGAVVVNWELSTDDGMIDQYNFYRREEGADYYWVTSLAPGSTAYLDDDRLAGERSYMISAAHHGSSSPISCKSYDLI